METLKIRANAKINLALAVKYKREDGYHEIESIFQEIDFHDTIHISKSDNIEFLTDSRLLQNEAKNSCIVAAEFLREEFDISGLKIRLDKKLPIGAGLGGGSSDAAAVIRGGLKLYGVTYSSDRLLQKAVKIGADVPFFLIGGTAYGSGKGEILNPIKIHDKYYIVLIFPDICISTKWAYKNLNLTLTRKYDDYKFKGFRFQNLSHKKFSSEFYNDFEHLIFEHYRDLASLKSQLYDQGAFFASLSGSGSAIYGLFLTSSVAEKAFENLSDRFQCRLSRPVNY